MAIHVIKMPDIGEGIAEVEVVQWHVQAGDNVSEDQVLAEVMTDKATIEVPSPVHGKVISLGGKVGELMAVGSELIRLDISEGGEDGQGGQGSEGSQGSEEAPVSTPDRATASAAPPLRMAQQIANRALASPAVRRRARELDIDIQQVRGSGPDGRITQRDLEAHQASAPAQESKPEKPRGPEPAYRVLTGQHEVPVIGLRRKIAEKMQESKRHIPHFSYVEEVDVTELEALRAKLNERRGNERGKLSVLPFLIRAMVVALREYPALNARFDDEAQVVTHYGAVHMGVATQTEAGLMVPVLRNAESLDLWSCAAEVARLAQAARTGKATREELMGSTITLSSLGPLGGIAATPVINYPEVAVVGVNRIVERPVIVAGAVAVRKMMNLSSSFDHRVVDGMLAAQFIQSVRASLECPALLFIE